MSDHKEEPKENSEEQSQPKENQASKKKNSENKGSRKEPPTRGIPRKTDGGPERPIQPF